MWRAFLLATLVDPTSVFGQDNSGWIGKRVITHYGAVLQIGNQVVDDEKRSTNLAVSGRASRSFRVYQVEQVNGNWLWLKAEKEGVEGWVKAEYVIPYDQAIDYYTNQIRANPTQSSWYISRGNVWSEKGEYDIAIADYNEAIRLEPSDETAFNNRGTVWEARKDYDKAIADYTESIRLDPKYSQAFNNRGTVWEANKEYDKAIADYTESIRLDPKYSKAFRNRASIWYHKQNYDKALGDYNEAIRLDPKDVLAYNNRGSLWEKQKHFDKAIADYNEALRIGPRSALALNSLAWLRATCLDEKNRDGKKALDSASEACQLDNYKDPTIIDTLAAAYAEVGNFDKAVEWQEKANKLYADPEEKKKGEERLKLYKDKKPYRQTD
jgi:tetratricopeptide (TPR) repeat protein